MKTVIATHGDGTLTKLEVPDNARFTFGPLAPGQSMPGGLLYLRGYLTKENQLFVLPDVVSFIDATNVKAYHVKEAHEDHVEWTETTEVARVGEAVVKKMRQRY